MKQTQKIHNQLRDEIILMISKEGFGRAWPNDTGLYRDFHTHAPTLVGTVGAPDIIGILRGGYFFGVEVKTNAAQLNKNQKNFRAMILKMGGLCLEGRSVDSVRHELLNAINSRTIWPS